LTIYNIQEHQIRCKEISFYRGRCCFSFSAAYLKKTSEWFRKFVHLLEEIKKI